LSRRNAVPTSNDIKVISDEVNAWMKQGLTFHPALKKALNRYNIHIGYDTFAKEIGRELGRRKKATPQKYPKQERRPKQLQLIF